MGVEGFDCTFCLISAVDACWCELKIYIFSVHTFVEYGGCFIIEALEVWLKAA